MKSIEVIAIGTKRRGREVLRRGTYDLCRDRLHVILRARCDIETTEVFRCPRAPLGDVRPAPRWEVESYHHETLRALPSLWQRLKAFVLCRDPPLPRAIAIILPKERQQ